MPAESAQQTANGVSTKASNVAAEADAEGSRAMPSNSGKNSSPSSGLNRYPWYAPRFWHGMRVRQYFSLLARNRFKIHFLGLGPAFAIGGVSFLNSAMYRIQELARGKRIRETELTAPPIFILGHWRSGTTLLHELLVQDPQFAFPTTYECFAPSHFLVTDQYMPWLCQALLPARRPMDNMEAGFDRPQEDEFALCVMGAPTPYLRMAFPNNPAPYEEFFDMENVAEQDLHRFRDSLDWFFRALTVRHQKRLVLKSPPHTGRIRYLSEWFPGAKFVHLSRNPLEVYSSTLKLWKTLDRNQGFQIPRYSDEELGRYVIRIFEKIYRAYRNQIESVPADQLIELRFEDLVRDPQAALNGIYADFDIAGFEKALPMFDKFLEQRKDYRPSKYAIDERVEAELRERWGWYFERYGY